MRHTAHGAESSAAFDASPSTAAVSPGYLAEKILHSRSALEGERKQVIVLFADLKGSMELLADHDPEEARQLLDPVLERMIAAVHRYEGTVNQVMGDGIMALFGAPIAHEDHAVRACYAALRMQASVHQYAAEVQRTNGVPIQIRVGLNSGEVVVRAIGSDLHMDYTAVGQTTHLAARMEQLAMPGSILITPAVYQLAEGYIQVKSLGPVPIKGMTAPVEVSEVTSAGHAGQVEEGLRLLAETLIAGAESGRSDLQAEAYRLKGELLRQQAAAEAAQAEACFEQALAMADRQQAKSWELRAAMSLSRLWQQQGKRDEARELLAPI